MGNHLDILIGLVDERVEVVKLSVKDLVVGSLLIFNRYFLLVSRVDEPVVSCVIEWDII